MLTSGIWNSLTSDQFYSNHTLGTHIHASFYFMTLETKLITPPPPLFFLCWLACCFFFGSKVRLLTLPCLGKALKKTGPAWETVNQKREGMDKFALVCFGGLSQPDTREHSPCPGTTRPPVHSCALRGPQGPLVPSGWLSQQASPLKTGWGEEKE